MRRDLVIALLVSVLLHAGLAFGFNRKPTPPLPLPPPTIEIIAVPPPEPDEPLPADTSDQPPGDPAPAPPMQADLPSVKLDTPFVQLIQPPPPPNLGRPSALITIPTGRLGSGNGGGLGNIFDLADLDQPPSTRPGGDAVPNYPSEMHRAGIGGSVEIEFTIDTEGNARDVRVISSTRHEFDAAAVEAALSSKFTPGRKGGRVVNTSRVRRTITFSIASGND